MARRRYGSAPWSARQLAEGRSACNVFHMGVDWGRGHKPQAASRGAGAGASAAVAQRAGTLLAAAAATAGLSSRRRLIPGGAGVVLPFLLLLLPYPLLFLFRAGALPLLLILFILPLGVVCIAAEAICIAAASRWVRLRLNLQQPHLRGGARSAAGGLCVQERSCAVSSQARPGRLCGQPLHGLHAGARRCWLRGLRQGTHQPPKHSPTHPGSAQNLTFGKAERSLAS